MLENHRPDRPDYKISTTYPGRSLDDRMVQKVPRNYFPPLLKIVRTAAARKTISIRMEIIYAKTIVIIICLILNKMKMTILMTTYQTESSLLFLTSL